MPSITSTIPTIARNTNASTFTLACLFTKALIGLLVRTPEVVNNASFLVIFPLTFISNAFVPLQSLPSVLQAFAEWNPVSTVVQAARELFGNTIGPFVSILLAGPVLALFGYAIHALLISRVSGTRTASLEGEGHYAQLILTLGIALILQNGGLIVFGSVLASIRTPLSSSAWAFLRSFSASA